MPTLLDGTQGTNGETSVDGISQGHTKDALRDMMEPRNVARPPSLEGLDNDDDMGE